MNWCDGEMFVPKKCCFCIPLRIGLLVMGYIKLTTTAILIAPSYIIFVLSFFFYDFFGRKNPFVVIFFAEIVTLLIILTLDVLLTIVFIIAVHSKKIKMLRFYYIYTIVMLIVCTLLVIIFICLDVSYNTISESEYWVKMLCMIAYGCINFVIQVYLILVMKSEIIKIRTNCKFRFVNDDADAECVLESDAERHKQVDDAGES